MEGKMEKPHTEQYVAAIQGEPLIVPYIKGRVELKVFWKCHPFYFHTASCHFYVFVAYWLCKMCS